MKRLAAFVLLAVIAFAVLGCGNQEVSVAGKVYTFENDGAGSSFSISVYEDGTYSYYEGVFSSYLGFGEWVIDGNILTLTDDHLFPVISSGCIVDAKPIVNHFRIEKDSLYFIEDGSSNFIYVDVRDGQCFWGSPLDENQ